jgi:CubicO group peptidase (beta-lactamase class C family)
MPRWLSLLLWLAINCTTSANPPELLAVQPAAASVTLSVSATARIDHIFRAFDSTRPGVPRTPGVAVGVIRNGSFLYERYFGYAWGVTAGPQTPISASTTFDLASESKQFTACAVALLASRNQVDLSAPVRQYLPEMQDRTVTVRQLLYHTNGFPSDFYMIYVRNEVAPAVLARIATSRPSVAHGTRFCVQ